MLPSLPGKVEQTGLVLPSALTFDEWASIGDKLRGAREAVRWWIGDWLAFGEASYGERYAQALDNAEWDYQTLRNFVWVARAIPHTQRRASLSWSHHAECAALEPEAREALLCRAVDEQWSVKDMREAAHADKPPKAPAKPKGIHIGNYMILEDEKGLYLSNKDGEVMEVNEAAMEEHLGHFWFTHNQ